MDAAVIAGLAAVAVAAWYFDVRRRPWKPCPSCTGGRRYAASGPKRWGDCRRCGSKGFVRRWGA